MLKHYRFSVTDIDSFERYLARDDVPDQEMLDRLNKVQESHPLGVVGRNFHTWMECPDFYHALVQGTFVGLKSADRKKYNRGTDFYIRDSCPEMIRSYPDVTEMEASKTYVLGDGTTVTLYGVIDAIWGYTAGDYKLVFSQRSAYDFLESFQWRAYLSMLGPQYSFRYDLWKGSVLKRGDVSLSGHIHSGLIPYYRGLEGDVIRRIEALVAWCRRKGWDGSEKRRRPRPPGPGQDPGWGFAARDLEQW